MEQSSIITAPSILSADSSDLKGAVRLIESVGADWVHVDILDGHFAPNLSFSPQIVADIRKHTSLPLDVHLMVDNPDTMIGPFAEAGADRITFHIETSLHAHRTCQLIRSHGKGVGLTLVPSTPIEMVRDLFGEIDLLLIMTVNPGFGGQSLIPICLDKVAQAKALRDDRGYSFHIQVDGGINEKTAPKAIAAGANVLVSGSAFFEAEDPGSFLAKLRGTSGVA
ncbi:MAG: ribulose-phosphate 3-epimerase [Alkalispirochaetaceae bacterium]